MPTKTPLNLVMAKQVNTMISEANKAIKTYVDGNDVSPAMRKQLPSLSLNSTQKEFSEAIEFVKSIDGELAKFPDGSTTNVSAPTWITGTNWDNTGTPFETFINKTLFPKINSTDFEQVALGNTFDIIAVEMEEGMIGQITEEVVIADSLPQGLDLTEDVQALLRVNYPKLITKLYQEGAFRVKRFTLNNNDMRLNYLTLGDATKMAGGAFINAISGINLDEERQILAMIIDYYNNYGTKIEVDSLDELYDTVLETMQNFQRPDHIYNEASEASGGALARYSTSSNLEDLIILSTNKIVTQLLNTKVANTFQLAGLDVTSRFLGWRTLSWTYKTTADVTITEANTIATFSAMGFEGFGNGKVIPANSAFTFDLSKLPEFANKFELITPKDKAGKAVTNENVVYIMDEQKIRYKRSTQDMIKIPFYNNLRDETTHALHFYTFKALSPFKDGAYIYLKNPA
ncbi:hypothetical protein [Lactococcus petauri]|uniref:hypothetical protein n=1 Tax=Lactococcus petauri TaxID=1940789 RepID=UPI002152171C|nr:hypothetical protein [Lactococcus petauri]MCR6590473.1 hypothetical protein [Lactococcus petauri]